MSLARASLTRPERPLFAACCFGWFVYPDLRTAAYLIIALVVLVVGHYLFRYGNYGEWLPNTYYAKYVHTWYEMGIPYLVTAAVGIGLYLLLPLTLLTLGRE